MRKNGLRVKIVSESEAEIARIQHEIGLREKTGERLDSEHSTEEESS